MIAPGSMWGLYVDLGHYDHKRGRWVRTPAAEYRCRHGCEHYASGADDVAQFCKAIGPYHSTHCPGRTSK